MIIYLGADHAGWHYKEKIKKLLTDLGYNFEDLGNEQYRAQDDYPEYARKVAVAVNKNKNSTGILICDSGAGMAIVANRLNKVRAVLAYNTTQTKHAREHNNANVLCLGSEYTPFWRVKKMIKVWLKTEFSTAKRHRRRVLKIDS